MTDKTQKIREELARLKEETSIGLSEHENGVEQGRMEIINALSLFLDSLQEEPVSEEWIEELRTKLDSLSKEDFKKVFDKYAIDFNEEPVSEDLEKIVEEIAEPTILNAYGTKELARRLRNTICGTSVSDELEKAANEIVNKAIPPLAVKYKDGTYVGKIMDCFDRKEFIDLVKAGAKWQKEQMMRNAIEGDITFDYYGNDDKTYGCIAHNSFCLEDFGLKDRDKVKVIIIKED